MKKLFMKDETWFAVLFIIIYVVGMSIADNISNMIGIQKSITSLFAISLSVIICIFVKKNDLLNYYGLVKPSFAPNKLLFYVPLVILSTVNIWFGFKLNYGVFETLFLVLSMVFVGFLEEIIFRGFLFKAMSKDNIKSAIILSSITFGIGHIVNLINGSGAELYANILQVCYATAVGFLFVILVYRGKSQLVYGRVYKK